MFQDYQHTVLERFLRYVQIDTQSEPSSHAVPSTEKQKDLGMLLVKELQEIGLEDSLMDEWGYVYATIPATSNKEMPVLCFCSHMDTAPDCSGTGVKPLVHENYDGSVLVLPDDPSIVVDPNEHPYLKSCIGHTLVTASGTTLLGADDKAGVAVIMDLASFLIKNPDLKHGKIRILFTPDEEIGRGVDKIDMKKLGADFGYTLDGGERGSLEDENFSADGVTIILHGVSIHPGTAKDKLVNSMKVAASFLESLPKDELSPETTEGRYGFIHPIQIEGATEKTTLKFIIRDFVTNRLEAYENFLRDRLEEVLLRFPGAKAEFEVKEQYRNMKEVLDQHPQVVEFASRAIQKAGLEVQTMGIRGGTDGSRLSFLGLPCPNLFTGEMALHGKQEYVSVQDMHKSVETLVHLVMIWEENS
jgi:tripeptide aminopeptidase